MAIKLQAILAAWKNFDLNRTQQELDETASEITLKQDESDVSRKKLVELLKESKKNSAEEMRLLASLIKSFQNEVDFLSKRSKFAESAFLKNYQKFLDIIDPVQGLEYAVGLEKKVCLQEELELENKGMKQTIKENNEELREAKHQSAIIKSLKDKIKKYEEQMEVILNGKIKELEKEYTTSYAEKEQLIMETHEHDTQKVKGVEEKCQLLQQSLEQSQSELFEVKSKLEDITGAKSSEIDILMNDLERANHQASTYQKQLAELKKHNESGSFIQVKEKDSNPDLRCIEVSSLEAEIAGKDKEISQLISDVKSLQTSLSTLKESSSSQIFSLQDALQSAKSTNTTFERRLSQQKDYEELRRELAIIKSIEFDSIGDLNNKSSSNTAASKPLELLLLEKNKSLQNENTSLKLKNEDFNSNYNFLDQECKRLQSLTVEQQNLISQLEADVSSIQSISQANPRDGISQMDLLSQAVQNSSPTLLATTHSPHPSSSETPPIIPGEPCPTATESLLSIVSAQRERFKIRNEELETEVAIKGNHLALVQNELDSLRADNIKLYEKIRFLQSYEGSKSSSDTLPESRYSNQYEKNLDPFIFFSQKEKQKRYSSLSPFEKVTLNIGHLILKSKGARTATFIYVSLLHCLVFVVLYKFAFTESSKRDFYSDCADKFAEHMHDVHGKS